MAVAPPSRPTECEPSPFDINVCRKHGTQTWICFREQYALIASLRDEVARKDEALRVLCDEAEGVLADHMVEAARSALTSSKGEGKG